MKSDARTKYTKRVLKDSFLQCLRIKPLNKITVKEVCAIAEVNRATFYKHYRDCSDLLEQIENEMLFSYKNALKKLDVSDSSAMTKAMLDMIDAHKELFDLLIYNHIDDTISNKMLAIAQEVCMDHWNTTMKKASPEVAKMLFTCLSAGLLRVIINEYGNYNRQEMISFVSDTVRNATAPYILHNIK